jgi:hypothetical protein
MYFRLVVVEATKYSTALLGKPFELSVKLRRQRLVMRNNQGSLVEAANHVRDGNVLPEPVTPSRI